MSKRKVPFGGSRVYIGHLYFLRYMALTVQNKFTIWYYGYLKMLLKHITFGFKSII